MDSFGKVDNNWNDFDKYGSKTIEQVEITSKIKNLGEVSNPIIIASFIPYKIGYYSAVVVIFEHTSTGGTRIFVDSPPEIPSATAL